ncbi:hypothetical protein C8Q79DRAFT_1010329 [Trametes meyenii]|nr:hypothetical protein C8Q79DRAFT_1010329 [Trametes meyenii]
MSKTSKRPQQKPKTSNAAQKGAAIRQIQATRKRTKAHSQISRSKVEDVTAQINGEFARVQNIYAKADSQAQSQDLSLTQCTVQELAGIMRDL